MTAAPSHWSLAGALALFGLVDFGIPVARHLARTGTTGVTFRRADPVQRVVGAALGAGVALVAGWSFLFGLLGPAPLGVVSLPRWVAPVGYALLGAGIVFVSAAQARMGISWRVGIDPAPTGLVTEGLYSLVRNPIYCGMLVVLAGLVLVTPSPTAMLLSVQLSLWVVLQTRLEESHLGAVHGREYREYAARTGRLIPWVGKLPS